MISILVDTDDQEHIVENVTAVIKVKDSPGALWNAIHKIGVSTNLCSILACCDYNKIIMNFMDSVTV